MTNDITISQLLANSLVKFNSQERIFIRQDLQMIVCKVLNVDKTYLYLNSDTTLEISQFQEINSMILRLLKGEPLAYILGYKYFWKQKLYVTIDTLIPRADTETLIEEILRKVENKKTTRLEILDLGTGTGAIALALAGELPNSDVLAIDFSEKALEIAKKNAKENNIGNVDFVQSSWYENLSNRKFDIIVSNPPYIDLSDTHIDDEVKKYEPVKALFAEDNGLADIKLIISQAATFLKKGGLIYIEHGFAQAQQVRDIFKTYGFEKIITIKDLNDRDRCTLARVTF